MQSLSPVAMSRFIRGDVMPFLKHALNVDEEAVAKSEGWGLFECEDDFQLQKIDEMDTFKTDEQAHAFVKSRVDEGSALHIKVKTFLETHSKHEHDIVFGNA